MDAKSLFVHVLDKYRTCKSYSDEGEVITTSSDEKKQPPQQIAFKTFFVRPNYFRFFWQDGYGDGNTVWCDGKKSHLYFLGKMDEQEHLSAAIAGATGVSSGSAHTIPRILMPDQIAGRSLSDFSSIELVKEQLRNDGELIHLRGLWGTQKQDIWLNRSNMTIVRLEYTRHIQPVTISPHELQLFKAKFSPEQVAELVKIQSQMKDYDVKVTCVYNKVEFDQNIPLEMFEFKPSSRS
ncbi:MAG: hypothetical protein U0103_11170 [Candidatus Obscuribacterales bacterium]|nr:hypothetical protein [Cyanobacteria bacterium SZAS LIN-5]